ncbi:MAG: helix-turn-helix transcriptional regulator [Theionarchaea archaeon]|nr:helix-turn-helix transcriptional regulator [Theionarchaea archaeon]
MPMTDYGYRTEYIGVREFPPFIRVTLNDSARKELLFHAMKKVGKIKRDYDTPENVFDALYGKKKGKILQLISEKPQTARKLIAASGLSPSAVYHFLKDLRNRHIISKEKSLYTLEECDCSSLFLDEIVKMEEDPALRRRYGISIKELELAYFLWDALQEIGPDEESYGRTYHSKYTLADAIHRWKTGRTDIPVWALNRLAELSESQILLKKGGVVQYHLPPGIPVNPLYEREYNLPVHADSTLDKIFVQLVQKMSKTHLYTFPKRRKWLFEKLHARFGAFDDSNWRIPSAITEILKEYYGVKTLNRSKACIPSCMKVKWGNMNPLSRITEESSLLLHIISLSSRSDGGFEVTSRSHMFLEEVSRIVSGLGLGELLVHKKHARPHFRVYLSESKVAVLRRYAHFFREYPDLEIWLRMPLNQIAEKLVLTEGDTKSVERLCREELFQFVESILKSLERRKKVSYGRVDYTQYREDITDYFWKQKLIPSPRRVEELVEMRLSEEIYV